ncbi:MAG: LCP family protein [Lachnospiraceae bacterium]|nr:LCP family protein [Lachnospiraceae bacterium]
MSDKTGQLSRRARRRKRRKVLLIVEIIILLLLLAVLFFWLKFGMINFRDIGSVKTNKLSKQTEQTLSGYTNFVVFGVDSRSSGESATAGGNTDVQIIVSINNDTKKIRMASVYRDTLLNIDPQGTGTYSKSNAAYARGGEKQALEMMNGNLDLNIEKFVTFDFAAVTDVIDDVGGIEVDVSDAEYQALNSSRWPTIPEVARLSGKKATYVTKPGLQTLNGVQACAYCRIRHTSDGKGDYGRAERQRKVMSLVIDKVKKASLSQLNSIVDDVLPKVSTNFSATEIISLATAAKSYSVDKSFGFPFDKWNGTMNTYGSIIVPCTLETNVEKLHQKMFDEMNFAPTQTVRTISQQISYRTGKTEADVEDFSKSEGNIGVDDTTTEDTTDSTSTTTN